MDDGLRFASLSPAEQERIAALTQRATGSGGTMIHRRLKNSSQPEKGFLGDGRGDVEPGPSDNQAGTTR